MYIYMFIFIEKIDKKDKIDIRHIIIDYFCIIVLIKLINFISLCDWMVCGLQCVGFGSDFLLRYIYRFALFG